MNQIKRYGFFFAAGILLASAAWANETTVAGKVENVDTADQSFKLKATPKTAIHPGSAEVNVTSKTDFVGVGGLAQLKTGDKVQVESDKKVSGEVQADTVTKI